MYVKHKEKRKKKKKIKVYDENPFDNKHRSSEKITLNGLPYDVSDQKIIDYVNSLAYLFN